MLGSSAIRGKHDRLEPNYYKINIEGEIKQTLKKYKGSIKVLSKYFSILIIRYIPYTYRLAYILIDKIDYI